MQLIHEKTRLPVKVGDTVTSFRGEETVIRWIEEPHKPASTGRVYVSKESTDMQAAYFPSVFGLVWEGRSDR